MIRHLIPTAVLALSLVQASRAGETSPLLSSKSPLPELVEVVEVVEDPWDVDAWIDGWIIQLAVEINQETLGFDHSLFLGFDDIISNLDWIAPVGADIRYGRFGFMPDFVGMKLSGGSGTPGPLYDDLDIGLKMWILNLVGYYRVIEKPNYSLDIVGGARNLFVDLDLAFSGGPVGDATGALRSHSKTEIWDGVVGFRAEGDLSDRVFYSVYGDVGTGDSELTWQVLASLGYQVSQNLSAALGYRYLHYEEESNSTSVGLTGSGPQITLKWDF